ncbi:hypothetical protein VMF7928_00504 [Vibrio marisflavi CECT 7928]|uniref:Uncharacterized protein n=1 Tax=Vibrio marisflavi CECT 7928 TaxID=634439 RepID=A0ABN8E140_9VIBR|nr:hypothetical protein VMF7928_00504 [Vibrio marisflavi CECT 7928]
MSAFLADQLSVYADIHDPNYLAITVSIFSLSYYFLISNWKGRC